MDEQPKDSTEPAKASSDPLEKPVTPEGIDKPPAPEAEEQKKKRGLTPDKVLFYLAVALLVLGIGGYFGGGIAWRALRAQRARAQATAAEKFLKEQKYPEAQRAIRTAIHMAPNDPFVLRTTASWCSLAGLPEGLIYWDRLFEIIPPTQEDRLKQLDLALALRRLDVSRRLLKDLLRTNEHDREVLVRTVVHHSQTGQPDIAIKAARVAIASQPNDPQLQYMLGALLLESPDRPGHLEARGVLWNVALGNSAWRDPAVDMLARTKLLNTGDRLLLIHTIEARKPLSLADRMRVLDLRLSMASDRTDVWRQAEDLREQYPGWTNQLQLARWLGDAGGTNRAISMLPREGAGTNRLVAGAMLDLLIRWKAWDEIRSLLQQTPVALNPSQVDAAQGVLAFVGGRSSEAAGYFANALQKAGGRPGELIQLANYAELARQPAIAAGALVQAAEQNPMLTVQLCRRALALVQPMEDLAVARRTLERLGEFLPGEPSVLLERSWLDLLSGERMDRAGQTLTGLLDHPVLGQEALVILSFADLKRGDAAGALTRLESLPVEREKLAPRLQAVCAAVLHANNQREPARRLALQIRTDQLRKKEQELIAPLL